jgi:tRNA U54 and U55 pseudouridine synthase Pus10
VTIQEFTKQVDRLKLQRDLLEMKNERLQSTLESISRLRALHLTHRQDGHGNMKEWHHYMCLWCENEADTKEEIVHSAECPTRIAAEALSKVEE